MSNERVDTLGNSQRDYEQNCQLKAWETYQKLLEDLPPGLAASIRKSVRIAYFGPS